MKKIKGCTRDNAKEVLHDIALLLKGQLQYDIEVVGDDKDVKKYSLEYHEKIQLIGDINYNGAYVTDTKVLNLEEIIDYIFWLLLLKKDFPLKKEKDKSRIKGYANVKSRSNPATFLKGRNITPEGAQKLAETMHGIINPISKDLEKHYKEFLKIYKHDNYECDEDFYKAVAEHFAELINDGRFMPTDSYKKISEKKSKEDSDHLEDTDFTEDMVKTIKKQFPQFINIECINTSVRTVYVAQDVSKSFTDVAIKVYPSDYARFIPLFFNDNLFKDIKSIIGFGLIDRNKDYPICLIMRYKKGDTFDIHFSSFRDSEFKTKKQCKHILQALMNVAFELNLLHEKNIYYGDLKPQNIIVDSNNKVWLCDFSEANYNGSKFPDKTFVIEHYRSPEMTFGGIIDYRSDIFQFGIILSDFLSCFNYNIELYCQLSEIVKKCVMKKPDDRYQSALELNNDLFKICFRFDLI